MRIAFSFIVLGFAATLIGCRGSGPVAVHPVKGQVLYGGQPAAGVQVYLFPTSAPQVPEIPSNPHGVTGSDGKFTLTTFKEGDGAAEGGYMVILLWPRPTKDDEEDTGSDRLLGWYDAAHTKLSVNIKTGENTLPPFTLPIVTSPPEPSQGIPGRN